MSPAPKLHVTAAAYRIEGYRGVLVLTVNGREAVVTNEAKPAIAAAGLVYLGGDDWEDELPPIDFTVPGEPGNVTTLRGFTADRVVFQLWQRFRAACDGGLATFHEGPVAIPRS